MAAACVLDAQLHKEDDSGDDESADDAGDCEEAEGGVVDDKQLFLLARQDDLKVVEAGKLGIFEAGRTQEDRDKAEACRCRQHVVGELLVRGRLHL